MRITAGLIVLITQLFLHTNTKLNAQERLRAVSPVAFGGGAGKAEEKSSYLLRPGDTVEVSVYREADLATKAKLDRDGTVNLPLIGEVRIGGLSVKQARLLITDLYERDYLVAPQVSLSYTAKDEDSAYSFSVLGSVAKAGVFSMPKGKEKVTIREAIAMAGGATRYANESRIKVRRRVGNDDIILEVDLRKMNDDATMESFFILSGDSINVPERVF